VMLNEMNDDEGFLGRAVFGTYTKPAKWGDINLEYDCPECGKSFILETIEY